MTPSSKKAASTSSKRGGAKQPAPGKQGKQGKQGQQAPPATKAGKGSKGSTGGKGSPKSTQGSRDRAEADDIAEAPPKGRARVLQASKQARSKAKAPAGRSPSSRTTSSRSARSAPVDDEVLTGELVDDRAGPEPDEHDGAEPAPAATGWRALLAPSNPEYVAPKERQRPWWGLGDVALWGFVSIFALPIFMSIGIVALLTNMGYDVTWPVGDGARMGEATRQLMQNAPVEITKSVADIPLWLYQLTSVLPLWIGFVAGPVWVSYRKGLGFVRDWKVRMELIDVPVGLAVGLFSQLVMVAVVYRILFLFVPEQDVSARARDLTDRADSPWMIAVLLLTVGVITPIVEELFFRGLSHQSFKNRLGRWWGAAATAAFFAITHGSTILIPPLFIFAFALSWLVDRFDRLGPAVWAHIGFNMVTAVSLVWDLGIG